MRASNLNTEKRQAKKKHFNFYNGGFSGRTRIAELMWKVEHVSHCWNKCFYFPSESKHKVLTRSTQGQLCQFVRMKTCSSPSQMFSENPCFVHASNVSLSRFSFFCLKFVIVLSVRKRNSSWSFPFLYFWHSIILHTETLMRESSPSRCKLLMFAYGRGVFEVQMCAQICNSFDKTGQTE